MESISRSLQRKGLQRDLLRNVSHSWISDVEMQNADFGIDLNSTNFCTVNNVSLTTSKTRAVEANARGTSGHHGIDVSHGTENLVTNFNIRTQFVHDISVEWYALHTVFSNGRGENLNMDHHREANYSSLFSNLDCGEGKRPFESGGAGNRGAHSGAYSTFWNVHASGPLKYPAKDFGPLLNFVGMKFGELTRGHSINGLSKRRLRVVSVQFDLHQAMRARRLRR